MLRIQWNSGLAIQQALRSCFDWFEARVFPISPCSTDIERFFSTTGFICADHRGSLLPDTINMLASLNSWLRTKHGYNRSRRQQKSADTCQRFTSINLALQLIPGPELENEDDSEEEGL